MSLTNNNFNQILYMFNYICIYYFIFWFLTKMMNIINQLQIIINEFKNNIDKMQEMIKLSELLESYKNLQTNINIDDNLDNVDDDKDSEISISLINPDSINIDDDKLPIRQSKRKRKTCSDPDYLPSSEEDEEDSDYSTESDSEDEDNKKDQDNDSDYSTESDSEDDDNKKDQDNDDDYSTESDSEDDNNKKDQDNDSDYSTESDTESSSDEDELKKSDIKEYNNENPDYLYDSDEEEYEYVKNERVNKRKILARSR